METIELKAEIRDDAGKGVARKLRSRGKLPAVIYGKGLEPKKILIDAKNFDHIVLSGSVHHIITINLEENKNKMTTIVKEVQKHPYLDNYLHVDFQSIDIDQEIESVVPVQLVGESLGQKEGGIVQHGVREVHVFGIAKDMPDHLDVDISLLNIGDSIRIADIKIDENLKIVSNPEETVISILPPVKVIEEVPEAEEEVTEPEVIEKEKGPEEKTEKEQEKS